MRGGFRFFCASVGTIWFFKVYSQEVKAECKLNCNRALRRCRLDGWSAMFICNAPPGHKKNFRCALLVIFRSATHICKNSNCNSVSGTPEVHWTSGDEFLEASSLVGAFFILIVSLAAHFRFHRFFCTSRVPCCSSISPLLLLLVNKLKKFIFFQRRHRKFWNLLLSASFGLIYMSEGQNETHLWWHCPFNAKSVSVIRPPKIARIDFGEI